MSDLPAIRERHRPVSLWDGVRCLQCKQLWGEAGCDTAQVLAALDAGIDVDRLALSLQVVDTLYRDDTLLARHDALQIAAEYAALADTGSADDD